MAIVKQSYTGNGVQKLFTFSFPYLDPSHVLVTVDDTPTSAWTFANDNTVEFTVAPADGAAILIYRQTANEEVTAILTPGGPVPAEPINENFLQTLYLGQETDDKSAGAIAEAEAATASAAAANATAASALSTANTASSNASTAVSTANAASATAGTALTTANSAVTTANSASSAAASAVSTANTAAANATTAINTANAASSVANDAADDAALALSTANSASVSAANAVSTANSASTAAASAVTTANAASSAASSAVTTANAATTTANAASAAAASAVSAADAATTTANTASTNASTALSTANTALSTANSASTAASNAVSTANSAASDASTALSTANTALSTSNNALNIADNAESAAVVALANSNAAIAAVANAVAYTPVTDLTALGLLTPADGAFFELQDSTGAESSGLITGVTPGLVGDPGLTFRLRYDDPPGIFTFLGYFSNDPETRYAEIAVEAAVVAAQADATQALSDAAAAQSTANSAVSAAAAAQSTADAALPKAGGTMTGNITFAGGQSFPGVLPLSGGTMTGNITFNGAQSFPVSGIQSASTTQVGVVQLTDSTASTSTTTAATPNSVKSSYDLANTANSTANSALTTANGALQRTGGTMTGNITFNGAQTFPVSGIQAATTGQVGVVQLTDSVSSTSTTTAATPNSVKSANDNANTRASKSGDTFTGSVSFPDGSLSAPAIRFANDTDTGWFRTAGGDMSFSYGGRESVKFRDLGEIVLFGRGTAAVMLSLDRTDTGGGGNSQRWEVALGGAGALLFRDGSNGQTPMFSVFPTQVSGEEGRLNTYNPRTSGTQAAFCARAILKYNGNSNTLVYSRAITSVTKLTNGQYQVTMSEARGDVNYTVCASSRVNTTTKNFIGTTLNVDQTTTTFILNNSNQAGTIEDSNMVHVAVFDG